MARQLVSEKPFVVFLREFQDVASWKRYYGIVTSYTIMRAKIINLLDDVFSMDLLSKEKEYGTIVHLDMEENIQAALPLIPRGIRYFGYVNATEKIITNSTANSTAYVGIPISLNYLPDIDTPQGMWDIVYPHVTLFYSQSCQLNECIDMIGREIDVKLCDAIVRTPHTMSYDVMIKYEHYHVTRCVADGKGPHIAKREMEDMKEKEKEKEKEYLSLVGFPVLM